MAVSDQQQDSRGSVGRGAAPVEDPDQVLAKLDACRRLEADG